MSQWKFCAVIVLLMVSVTGLHTQARPLQEHESNARCITKLRVPSYPYIARVSISSGALKVTLGIGENGSVESQTLEVISDPQNEKLFQPAIAQAIKESQFREDCAGQSVRLTFRFKIGNADAAWFEYPNTYEITAAAPVINRSGRRTEPTR